MGLKTMEKFETELRAQSAAGLAKARELALAHSKDTTFIDLQGELAELLFIPAILWLEGHRDDKDEDLKDIFGALGTTIGSIAGTAVSSDPTGAFEAYFNRAAETAATGEGDDHAVIVEGTRREE